MRTYGSLILADREWAMDVDPHVAMKMKRWFVRAVQTKQGEIRLNDTPDTAVDLLWMLERFPLVVSTETLQYLGTRAQQARDTEAQVVSILGGDVDQARLAFLDPARPPRHYQTIAAELAAATGRLLLTDELGLGKSMSGLLLLAAEGALPAVVVTLTPLPRQWLAELAVTFPTLTGHIITSGTPYNVTKRCRGHTPDVLITNYHKLSGWADYLANECRTVIFDEMQELRHDGTQKYSAAQRIAHKARYRMGLTATPVYNYGGEIWTIMHVLDPEVLGDRGEFAREWCTGQVWLDGKTRIQHPESLVAHMRDTGAMLHRTRVDVGRELPAVIPVVHEIDIEPHTLHALTEEATHFAQLLLTDGVDRQSKWQAAMDLDWRVRMATGVAKAPSVAAFVHMLLEAEEPVVLFGWHRDVYDIWLDKLAKFRPVLYTGTESANQKHNAMQSFLDGDTDLLIMSLRAGAGLDGLQARCKTAVFGELDWSPGVHAQCVGRLHRDGQADPVLAYYLVGDSGSDPVVAEVLQLKRAQSDPINTPDAAHLVATEVDTGDRMKRLARDFLTRRGIDPDTLPRVNQSDPEVMPPSPPSTGPPRLSIVPPL